MRISVAIIILISGLIRLQVKAQQMKQCVTEGLNLNKADANLTFQLKTRDKIVQNTKTNVKDEIYAEIVRQTTTNKTFTTATTLNPINCATVLAEGIIYNVTTTSIHSSTLASPSTPSKLNPNRTITNTDTNASTTETPTNTSSSSNQYCTPSLCEYFNGTHATIMPHIACKNSGNFDLACGSQPRLLKMSERRRNLILGLHNLARSRIATGQVEGYKSASHMPQLKWDHELEYLATLHVKRCKFEHDLCHNTPRYPYSGQNIGYFWKGANITSHSRRMKNFIVNWYKEYINANQTFIDAFQLHPDNKIIGHFTAMVGDRVHHVGCATIRFYESNLTKLLMTCNYDYNNFIDEPVYKTGPAASKCAYKKSKNFPGLCDWKVAIYEYDESDDEVYESSSNVV